VDNLGQLGGQQQAMSLADINAQMQAGALQRGIGQQALDAQRANGITKSNTSLIKELNL
jgi:hypothetical protein